MSKHLYNGITSIRNSYKVYKDICTLINTKLNRNILNRLKIRAYIKDFNIISKDKIEVVLFYSNRNIDNKIVKLPHLYSIDAVSKPGFRKYFTVEEIKYNLKKYNINYLVSTNQNILFGDECIKKNIGGEVLISIV